MSVSSQILASLDIFLYTPSEMNVQWGNSLQSDNLAAKLGGLPVHIRSLLLRIPARTARLSPTSIPHAWRIFTLLFFTDLKRLYASASIRCSVAQYILSEDLTALVRFVFPIKTPMTLSPSKLRISPPWKRMMRTAQSRYGRSIFAVVCQGQILAIKPDWARSA